MRRTVHEEFDALWRSGLMSREGAYKWLCITLNIPEKEAHVAVFTWDRCVECLEAVKAFQQKRKEVNITMGQFADETAKDVQKDIKDGETKITKTTTEKTGPATTETTVVESTKTTESNE